jgi:dUTP pyrophosphatase
MLKTEFSTIRELKERLDNLEDEVLGLKKPKISFELLCPDAKLPSYQTAGAAGMDLYAANEEPITAFPDATVLVPLGFAMALPPGYEAQVRPRSGLAVKGVAVANSPGTIDEDYRGEVKVIIRNHGHTLVVHKGDRIAQMVIARVAKAEVVQVESLDNTQRGQGGFGSTGIK